MAMSITNYADISQSGNFDLINIISELESPRDRFSMLLQIGCFISYRFSGDPRALAVKENHSLGELRLLYIWQ